MSQFPHELIRQVRICSRAAAGLPDYDPSDPNLLALPSLSDAIAGFDPSPPELRCKSCKGRLLRGLDSIVCVYCGYAPQNDVVRDPIWFNSTVGYQWLLRSLGLNGSERIELPGKKSEQEQGQSSPKPSIPLSELLDFKIPWPAEKEKSETSVSDKPRMAPDNFFFKSKKDDLSDTSTEEPFMPNRTATSGTKDVVDPGSRSLFPNVQSSEPTSSSLKDKTGETLSEWEADFQWADSGNQQVGEKSSDHVAVSSPDSDNKFQDAQSFDHSTGLEVDFGAHLDSVFGPGKDLNDGKTKDNSTAPLAFDDWNSDGMWNNLSSDVSHVAGGIGAATVSTDNDDMYKNSNDVSTSDGLFQDFQSQTKNADATESKTTNEDHDKRKDEDSFGEWNEFTGSTSLEVPIQDEWTGISATARTDADRKLEYSGDLSTSADLFQDFQWQNQNAESTERKTSDDHKRMDEDPFGEWNGFTGSTNLQVPIQSDWTGNDATVSTKVDHRLEYSDDLTSSADFFQDFHQQTKIVETTEGKTSKDNKKIDEDSFEDWNDFTGSTSLQVPAQNDWTAIDNQTSTSVKKSSDIDLLGLDTKLDSMDFVGFSQPNPLSTSTSKNNILTEGNTIISETSASNGDTSSASGKAANNTDISGISTDANDDVKMLISQMHDLSFMLESELHIPPSSDAHSSSPDH